MLNNIQEGDKQSNKLVAEKKETHTVLPMSNEQPNKYSNDDDDNKSNKSDDEVEVEEKPKELPGISYFKLFHFATSVDWFLMIVGGIAAMINGIALPMFSLIFGEMTDSFKPSEVQNVVSEAGKQSLYFLYIGLGSFFLSWVNIILQKDGTGQTIYFLTSSCFEIIFL